jgi:beta-fructofuranosidase
MAAALPDGSGAVLQYSSPDLQRWTYDGVLCSRPDDPTDEVPTGAVWECPQLFAMGDRWVLVVSVSDTTALLYAAAAVGSYDGATFTPESWQRLTHGASAYATTAFVDRDGRRCMLSWLREEPRDGDALTERAGAHSVVSTLTLRADGALTMQPHPGVDALRGDALPGRSTGSHVRYDVADAAVDLTVDVPAGPWCEIVEGGRSRAVLAYDRDRHRIRIERAGLLPQELPLRDPGTRIRLLLDADILEIFGAGSYGAYRLAPATGPGTTLVLSQAAAADVRPLGGT